MMLEMFKQDSLSVGYFRIADIGISHRSVCESR